MIKILLVLLLINLSLVSKDDIDAKISKTSKEIKNFSNNCDSINTKLENNAKEILEQKKRILEQQKYLNELKDELSDKEKIYQNDSQELQTLNIEQKKLQKVQDEYEQDLVFSIAKSVSLSIILEQSMTKSQDSIIEVEVLNAMLKRTKEQIVSLNEKFYQNAQVIEKIDSNVKVLEKTISQIDLKRKNLQEVQLKNKKDLVSLEASKKEYKKELQNLLAKQDTLKKTLSQLKIIKIDEEKKEQEQKQREEAFAMVDDSNLPNVKKKGSSYNKLSTKKYRGLKTIPPVEPYTISKNFGTYTDPIYGIKIFNESVSLKTASQDAKVKTVFNGKVIYADKTAVLDNIVIVEHQDGLHTIYANLSQISPEIKKGKKIKKGYTIGRVQDELIFEVTQKDYHINPVELFQ